MTIGRPKGSYSKKYIHPITKELMGFIEWKKLFLNGNNNINILLSEVDLKILDALKQKEKIRTKRYYQSHKNYYLNYQKIYRNNHRSKLREYNREYSKTKKRIEYKKLWNVKAKKNNYNKRVLRESIKYGLSFEELLNLKNKCSLCGFDKYPSDIHHIDKNPKNNNKVNLISLCPTCHFGIHRGYITL